MAWNGVSTLPSYVKVFDTVSFVDNSDNEIGSIDRYTVVPVLWVQPPGNALKSCCWEGFLSLPSLALQTAHQQCLQSELPRHIQYGVVDKVIGSYLGLLFFSFYIWHQEG